MKKNKNTPCLKVISFVKNDVDFALVKQGMINKETIIILGSNVSDEVGFLFDQGTAEQRMELIYKYLTQHKQTILEPILKRLNVSIDE